MPRIPTMSRAAILKRQAKSLPAKSVQIPLKAAAAKKGIKAVIRKKPATKR